MYRHRDKFVAERIQNFQGEQIMESKTIGASKRVGTLSLWLIDAAKKAALLELRKLQALENAIKEKMDSDMVAGEDKNDR